MTLELEETYGTNMLYSIMRFVSSSALVVDILFIILLQVVHLKECFANIDHHEHKIIHKFWSHRMSQIIIYIFMINIPIQS